jgi:hypothetical protein
MPVTPDRKHGHLVEDDYIQFEDRTSATGAVGTVYRKGSDIFAHDGSGEFNIRTGGGGLTEGTHRALDQLVHLIAESSYEEYEYTGNRVDAIRIYTDGTKTTKVRETEFTYTGAQVTTIVIKQYDSGGLLDETLTETLSYTGAKLDDITRALT